jgi:hypothetical protein
VFLFNDLLNLYGGNLVTVFAVRIKYSDGRLGYHSVWNTRELAERQVSIHNGNWRWEYFVEEKEPQQVGQNWYLKGSVKFEDSIGWMPVYGPNRCTVHWRK